MDKNSKKVSDIVGALVLVEIAYRSNVINRETYEGVIRKYGRKEEDNNDN